MNHMSNDLKKLAALIRYYSLISTTAAGSGHPTSSMSAADLMTVLMFGGHKRFDSKKPKHPNNDRLIFSKGHASPLFYSLWAAAGEVNEKQLMTLRDFDSELEGHPTMRFRYTEVPTGSLGQGLSVGVCMAINAKYLDKLPYRTYVLLGDSEMAEGSVWEAMALAAHYKLDNLVVIIDVNRLGQRGETMQGHDVEDFAKKARAFGWESIIVEGHNLKQINRAYAKAQKTKKRPTMIIAKTLKGKGVKFIENKNGWHGKALSEEELKKALKQLGSVDTTLRGNIRKPLNKKPKALRKKKMIELDASYKDPLATRKAYGHALVEMYPAFPDMVVLDAEVSNSTYAGTFKKAHPKRFFEMFIAEQNMVGVALGLAKRGKRPFVSTFAEFFSRAFDQIRMAQYADANITFVGSHAGVSIGADGASQMGLEDIALFRSIRKGVVLYPADHVADEKLTILAAKHDGISYIRTTRADKDPLYKPSATFKIGGSKVLKKSKKDVVTLISAGITLYEALKAYEQLKKQGINACVIDLYSIKPIDKKTLEKAAHETQAIITIEDHYPEGGIGEAVSSALSIHDTPVHSLAVKKIPRSGTPEELLAYEEIDSEAIVEKVNDIMK